MEILQRLWSRRCSLVNTPHLKPELKCSANCLQNNSSSRATQKTQPLYCCTSTFTAPLHSNGRGMDHMENIVLLVLGRCMLRELPNNGLCLQSHCLATGLYVTVLIYGNYHLLLCCRPKITKKQDTYTSVSTGVSTYKVINTEQFQKSVRIRNISTFDNYEPRWVA
jgi:hypothetical protein